MENIIVTNGDMLGCLWFIGWLFTIGYLKLSFWKGVLGLVVWPYYIGKYFRTKKEQEKNVSSTTSL